ncbi:hypothetical protein [Nostoc sp.]
MVQPVLLADSYGLARAELGMGELGVTIISSAPLPLCLPSSPHL